mmetsp:Transcript_98821/g.283880  ORF Transcript_98821/g.283880 Transcript_98821/m.283880 type:complete len:301 (+) Transcript_98821:67-969(+)
MNGSHRWFPWICNCSENLDVDSPANAAAGSVASRCSGSGAGDDLQFPPTLRYWPKQGGGASASSASSSGRASGRRSSAIIEAASQSASTRRGQHCERVLVHVYDLGDSFLTRSLWNSVAKSYGAFHTGVEVYGREWLFGVAIGLEGDSEMVVDMFIPDTTGICWHAPKANVDHSFRETLSMGFTALSESELMALIEQMKLEWTSSTYNMLSRNCHDFSKALCLQLGVSGLPPWVNSLAPTGQSTYEYLENTDSGYDGGEAVFDLLGTVKQGFLRGLGWELEVKPAVLPYRRAGLHHAHHR